MQERLAAPGQALEQQVDAAAELGLLDRGTDGGLLEEAESVPDLPDLMAVCRCRWSVRWYLDGLVRAQRPYHGWQPVVGYVLGRRAQVV